MKIGAFLDLTAALAGVCAIGLAVATIANRVGGDVLRSGSSHQTVRGWRAYTEGGFRLGDPDTNVTIVTWVDYECPFCRRMAPVISKLYEAYTDDVAVVYRQWPLGIHEAAAEAAAAAVCAGEQNRFFEVQTLLYETRAWTTDPLAELPRLAETAGVADLEAFERCTQGEHARELVEFDVAAVRELGGRGTPTVMVNERLFLTAPDSAELFDYVASLVRGQR